MSKAEQIHPKTKKLISELKDWCDQEYGRRSEVARAIGVVPSLFTEWLAARRTPDMDQGFLIEDFLRKHRRTKRKRKPSSPT
jgi:hypothetical protein